MTPQNIFRFTFWNNSPTPYIPQSEASECGLACIAMIAGRYGHQTNLSTLRQKFGLSLKGIKLKDLILIAAQTGFSARPVRGEMHDLTDMPLPAILHWNMNHFVVLDRVCQSLRGTQYVVYDPAIGPLKLPRTAVSSSWTGVALELTPNESFKAAKAQDNFSISQLWSTIKGLSTALFTLFLISIILQLATLAAPFYMQIAIDSAFPSFDSDLLLVLAISFGAVALLVAFTAWVRTIFVLSISSSLAYQIINNLFGHLLRLPLDYFIKRHVGDIISRFSSTQPITQIISQGMISGIIDGLLAIITLTLVYIYSPALAFISFIALFLYLLLRAAFLGSIKAANLDVINLQAQENSTFIETIRGISSIKSFSQELGRQRIWQQKKVKAVNAQMRLGRISGLFDMLCSVILAVERIVFIYVAVLMAMDSKISIGMIFAVQAYKQQFLDASTKLIEQVINYQIIKVHLARISDIALTQPESDITKQNADTLDFLQSLVIKNVSFRYSNFDAFSLNNVNCRINHGEFVVVTGASGSGKSTLIQLIHGLLQQTAGSIKLGATSISSSNRIAYRRKIASVSQNDRLFAGTIAENIAFFDADLDMDAVHDCARKAALFDDICAMPMGFNSLVGDMGSALSAGQLQRLFIARALYSDPSILIFDEGTANLDEENERKINLMIAGLSVTKIVITHRPETVQLADKVLFCRNGFVFETTAAGLSLIAGTKEGTQIQPYFTQAE